MIPSVGGPRIRRGSALPAHLMEEAESGRAYPMRDVVGVSEGRECVVLARRGRLKPLLYECASIFTRARVVWVMEGGERVAGMQFTEWHVDPDCSEDDFMIWMDAKSQQDCELAETLASHWHPTRLTRAGPLLEFRTLWVRPDRADGRLWPTVAARAIERAQRDECVAMVLKAFPLEYAGGVGDRLRAAFERRRKAMMRLYRSTLDVEPFSGAAGEEGWMWRPLAEGVPRPKTRRRRPDWR